MLASMIAAAAFVAIPVVQAQNISQFAPAATGNAVMSVFAGTWKGAYNQGPVTGLTVMSVDANGIAQVVYHVGDYPAWKLSAQQIPSTGHIVGNVLTVPLGTTAAAQYTLKGRTLDVKWTKGAHIQTGTLTQ